MTLIAASVIADLTANVDEAAMNENWTITSITTVDDGGGSSTDGPPTTQTVIGYMKPASGNEAGADQIKAQGMPSLFTKKTTVVGATGTVTQVSSGRVFEIVYVEPVTNYSTSLRIYLKDA